MEAKLPIRFRKPRIAWSVSWGLMVVLLVVLWARSYWRVDDWWGYTSDQHRFDIGSWQGRCFLRWERVPMFDYGIIVHSFDKYPFPQWAFVWEDKPFELEFLLPHWFPIAVISSLAAFPWIRLSKRYSLRTLLIATTLVALVLGLVVYTLRN